MNVPGIRRRVLVVDDCEEDRDVVARYLDGEQYTVQTVDTAEKGLRMITSERYDCVVVDYELPDANGVEFLAEVPPCDRPALVMVTGRGDEVTAVQALKGGAQDYLVKGDFGRVRLQQAVGNAIEVVTMRAEIEARRRELEHFAFTTAHDIKAPLRRIRALCDLLLQEGSDGLSGEAQEYLQLMDGAVGEITSFVDDMLALGRIGGATVSWEAIELGELARDVARDFSAALQEVGGELRCEALPMVRGERALLRRLLQNLVDNAIKYRSERSLRVTLAAREEEDGWVLSVADNGVGIPADAVDGIFGMFVRLHGDCEVPGAGLGLTICKRVAERHHGRLWVESQEGAGSTFHFWLPRLEGSGA